MISISIRRRFKLILKDYQRVAAKDMFSAQQVTCRALATIGIKVETYNAVPFLLSVLSLGDLRNRTISRLASAARRRHKLLPGIELVQCHITGAKLQNIPFRVA